MRMWAGSRAVRSSLLMLLLTAANVGAPPPALSGKLPRAPLLGAAAAPAAAAAAHACSRPTLCRWARTQAEQAQCVLHGACMRCHSLLGRAISLLWHQRPDADGIGCVRPTSGGVYEWSACMLHDVAWTRRIKEARHGGCPHGPYTKEY